jgi:hypothetical protein
MVVGSQVAHGVAYWWAYPQADLRSSVLAETGHGYLTHLPAVLAFLLAVEVVVLAVNVADAARGRAFRSLPPWAFVFIPVVGFTLQEHLERLFASGVFPWWAVLEPSFWRGLVLQVPLGLLAYLIARLLSRTASAVARVLVALRGGRRRQRRRSSAPPLPWLAVLTRLAPLAGAAAGRAPPLFVRV